MSPWPVKPRVMISLQGFCGVPRSRYCRSESGGREFYCPYLLFVDVVIFDGTAYFIVVVARFVVLVKNPFDAAC